MIVWISLNKRATILVDDANLKRYEKLKAQKLLDGKGELSFTSYVNVCLSRSNLSVDELVGELRLQKRRKDSA